MNIRLLICLACLGLLPFSGHAQDDTTQLLAIYNRVLEFPESKDDSAMIYAQFIEQRAAALHWPAGQILSQRLYGISDDLRGDYRSAIDRYLSCLELARRQHRESYESSALSDLGYDHYLINNYLSSKNYYLEAARVGLHSGTPERIISNYSNLGAAYNTLDMTDSALVFFNMALERARSIQKTNGLFSLRNNIGNAWFRKKEFGKALVYFRENEEDLGQAQDDEQRWLDMLNMGDVFIELNHFDSATYFLGRSMELARKLGSKRKEADVEKLYAKYYARTGDYRKAYGSLIRWHDIDTAYVNSETRNTMLELEEKFHAREREAKNQLLQAQVDREQLRNRVISLLALAVGGIALAVGISLYLIRKKNRTLEEQNNLIQAQNQRLAELNSEKNSLISVVSHDLSGPFSTIKMWLQLMEQDAASLHAEQRKALDRIRQSAENGEKLIRSILVVEKAETNRHQLDIRPIALDSLLHDIVREYVPRAESKGVRLQYQGPAGPVTLMSDGQLVGRIFDNLLSNAIKFTPSGRSVQVILEEEQEEATVTVQDEGVGIPAEEVGSLFTKYAKISSRPTDGESSTGLGLSIVKRLVDELGGSITCNSVEGSGTTFRVLLKK
jgi:signal transduction histidine kinase